MRGMRLAVGGCSVGTGTACEGEYFFLGAGGVGGNGVCGRTGEGGRKVEEGVKGRGGGGAAGEEISLGDIRRMATRWVSALFLGSMNVWSDVPKCRSLGGSVCTLFETCKKHISHEVAPPLPWR